jgi:putative membrane protein
MNSTVPKWLSPYLSSTDLDSIEQAVTKAELNTSGEVVPMVVRSSSTVGHVPILLILIFSLLFFAFDLDHYQVAWLPLPHWVLIILDLIVLFALVRWLAPLAIVERLLTHQDDQIQQVEQRALNEFYNIRVHHTEKATGILLFVSLMERHAVILGDEAIAQKIDGQDWQLAIEKLVGGVKRKNLAEGFCQALDWSAEVLQHHFPKPKDDPNQLKNHLVIKE